MWGSNGSRSVTSFSVIKRKKVTNMQWTKKEVGCNSTSSTSVVRTRSMSYVRDAKQTYHAAENEQVEVEKCGQWRVLHEAKK